VLPESEKLSSPMLRPTPTLRPARMVRRSSLLCLPKPPAEKIAPVSVSSPGLLSGMPAFPEPKLAIRLIEFLSKSVCLKFTLIPLAYVHWWMSRSATWFCSAILLGAPKSV